MMKSKKKRQLACLLATVVAASSCFTVLAVNGKEETKEQDNISAILAGVDEDAYDKYFAKFSDWKTAQTDIEIDCGETVLNESGQKVQYTFDVPEDGLYNLRFTYMPMGDTDLNPEITIRLDGEVPFSGMEGAKLFRWFENGKNEWSKDGQGNEFSPEQEEVRDWYEQLIADDEGIDTDEYLIALTQGTHVIEVESEEEEVAISQIAFTTPTEAATYEQVHKQYEKQSFYTGKDIVIQGEDAVLKSSSSLTAKSDGISVNVTPQSPYKNLINYIGGETWSEADGILTWEFEVKESGMYAFHMHYKQSGVVNGRVFRWMKLDGETPFKEAEEITFQYGTSWEWKTLGEEKPYEFYLEKGTHTLTLGVTLSEMADYYKELNEIVSVLGDEYLKISMITGDSPDQARDYELFKQIPEMESVFTECVERLETLAKDMKSMSESSSTQYVSSINSMKRVLNEMLNRKYLAHTYKKDFYDQYCSLSSLLSDMKQMPLSIDEMRFTNPEGSKAIEKKASFWKTVKFWVQSFIASFRTDFNSVSDSEEEADLKLWVNWGRDQTQVLNALIQESFTAKTGITVNVQTTDATVIQGILTDNAPDLALHVARSEPVNYAIRGAAYDLTQFADFEEVLERFQDGADTPYRYKDGVYALPDTQNFYIMYYRKDVLDSIGVKVPETWDEFIEATASIQRNNMNVYLPYTKLSDTTIVNTGVGGLNIYSTLLTQHGINVYNEEQNRNNLDTTEAIEVFDWWTDMYTKYKLEAQQDFYNRFRIGVTPLGIATYATYTTFSQTAPEIEGRWGIAMIPGVEQEDGSINRSSSGSGTGCVILNNSKHKEEAWEFIKWWTQEDTQLRYSRNVESLLGPVGRVATANVEAFSHYSWKSEDRDIMLQQWAEVVEIPEVPGSYYLSRAVDQAFWATVNGETSSEALVRWSTVANDEITRKIEEYSN